LLSGFPARAPEKGQQLDTHPKAFAMPRYGTAAYEIFAFSSKKMANERENFLRTLVESPVPVAAPTG
jgi:hypothetical protein